MKNEKLTRKEIIDNRLLQAGWLVGDLSQVVEEFDISVDENIVSEPVTPYGSHLFSDYVLLGKDGKPLAVVEAKKTSVDARVGEEQAKKYCHKIQQQYQSELPFCMYTNGNDIFFWDLGNYPPRKIYGFPTREDLIRLAFIRKNKNALADELIKTEIAGRPYQIEAIRSVFELLEQKKRKFLLVMATGTGKTRTCIAMVDALMRAGWVSRVLFLVDRIALQDQAIAAFKEHTPQYTVWPNQDEKTFEKDRRIYVSTYPTMLNIVDNQQNPLSPHFFDLIIIDESHRSIYNVYQNILTYFNTIVLGLTATPTDSIDHNTFQVFECEDGLPTFAYTFEDAVNNIPPYLSNYEVLKIVTKFQHEGIHISSISAEDQKKLIAEGKDPLQINFEGSELEKTVTNKGTNALIIKEFWDECIKDPNGVLPGKTIIFCASISHARQVKAIIDQQHPQHTGEIAKVIVSEDSEVYGKGGLLDQFKHNDFPRIAISVDMLDTGIDIPEVVNLVFAKPVFSYTKFWQMIGRGTRVLNPNNLKSWCHTKEKFLIIDCWDNFGYFKLNPKGKDTNSVMALPVRLFMMRLDKLAIALQKDIHIAENEKVELQKMIASLPEKNVVVLENKTELDKVEEPAFWENIDTEKLTYLYQTIAPVMRSISSVDFDAMRFEKDVVEFSIAQLNQEKKDIENLKEILVVQITELPLNINAVAANAALINQATKTSFWHNATETNLQNIVQQLAPLMRFRNNFISSGGKEFLNLQDVTYKKEIIQYGPENEQITIAKYKEIIETKVKELVAQNAILQKLQAGQNITLAETEELAKLMSEKDPYVTEKLLKRVYHNDQAKFIQFIKHILEIEPIKSFEETVTIAFNNFITTHNNLTSTQISFLNILKKYLIDKGKIERTDLVNAPFTQVHPQGILGVFAPNQINEIIELTYKLVA